VQLDPLQVWFESQQAPPQLMLAESQQTPVMHTCDPQEWPQDPQFELLLLRSLHEPPQQACPLPHGFPQAPQFAVLVLRSTHEPLHPACPAPQHLPPVQFACVHWALLVHEPPSSRVAVHLLVLQYCPESEQSVCCALPHAPCPLHTFALFTTVTLAHEAVEHAVSDAL